MWLCRNRERECRAIEAQARFGEMETTVANRTYMQAGVGPRVDSEFGWREVAREGDFRTTQAGQAVRIMENWVPFEISVG